MRRTVIFKLIAAFTTLLGIAVVYQNCAPAPTGESPWHSQSAPYSFAYEVQPDQIAYMSCSQVQSGADPSAYFTFRMGAYRNGGIRLSDEFSEKTSRMSTAQKVDSLSQSDLHSDTQLQVAVRSEGNLQQIFANDGNPKKGRDYSPVFALLGTESTTRWLVEREGNWTRYVPGEFSLGAAMEGDVTFSIAESSANSLREQFRIGGSLITWTFQEGVDSDNHFARAPEAGSGTSVYGRGLQLEFRKPVHSRFGSAVNNSDMPPRVLSGVTEVDLQRPGQASSDGWVCPPELQYIIIRNPNQATINNCKMEPDPPVMNAFQKIARNSLRVEDWYIDQTNRCVVSKKDRNPTLGQDCYGAETAGVRYALSEKCTKDGVPIQGRTAAENASCAHFVSICYRQ